MAKAPRARNKALIKFILMHRVFREAVEHYLAHAEQPTREEIAAMMERARLPYNETTRLRRASSVIGWIRWMMQLTAES